MLQREDVGKLQFWMWACENARMCKCDNARMWKSKNVRIWEMLKCQLWMWECENVRMWELSNHNINNNLKNENCKNYEIVKL